MSEQETGVVRLANTFVQLANSMVTEFDVVEMLDFLMDECVALSGLAAAGIMLSDTEGALRVVAASSETTRILELFELQLQHGPSVDCFRGGAALAIEDEAEQAARWPLIEPEFRSRDFGAVYALPLRMHREIIGALNLFARVGAPMSPGHQEVAQAMADVATIAILQHRAVDAGVALTQQLQLALDSRVAVEQAKGVIAEFAKVDIDTAFELLKTYARRVGRSLSEVGRDLASGRTAASEVVNT